MHTMHGRGGFFIHQNAQASGRETSRAASPRRLVAFDGNPPPTLRTAASRCIGARGQPRGPDTLDVGVQLAEDARGELREALARRSSRDTLACRGNVIAVPGAQHSIVGHGRAPVEDAAVASDNIGAARLGQGSYLSGDPR